MNKDTILGGLGVGSTVYSWMLASTPVLQWLSAALGIVATILAIIIYVRKINHKNSD